MASPELPNFDPKLLGELARGAQKVFDNAEALCREAKMLGGAGALSRALFLHQISLEECAKIDVMGAWATSVLAGVAVDEKKVLSALASHAKKNRTNAYLLEGSLEEREAKDRGDWRVARDAFKRLQAKFHEESNEAKNASLYVDFNNGTFVAPSDRITEDMLADTAARNDEFLGLTYPKLQMLLRWDKAPEEVEESIVAFVKLAEAVKDEKPTNAMAAIDRLIDRFLEIERAKRATSTGDS
jgi:AbiV family abortive infection protein